MNLKTVWYKTTHWETWHYFAKYTPLLPAWLWYCIRSGLLWFFTPSNPSLTFGGFEGHSFYSNRSNIMLDMVEDTVGRHDFLLTPCSAEMFKIIYAHEKPHQGCFGNLCNALRQFEITPDEIPTTFNIFMNVNVDRVGKVSVLPPLSKAGDYVIFEAKMDLIVGLTACSAGMSNNFSFKPIGYMIND